MSKNIDKELNSSSSKDLLYSEILNTSVTDHVHELLQKKKKSSTFHVERSSVLDKVSKLLQSFKEAKNDVKNIEIVEDGEPVIDMSVTLIDKADGSECESDDETGNADFENGVKDNKLIISSDSDSDTSNGGEEKVLDDRNVLTSSDSESELSENEREGNVFRNLHLCSDGDIKDYELGEKTINCVNLVTSSDSDDNTQENQINVLKEAKVFNSNSTKFHTKSSTVVCQNDTKFQDSDDELSNQEKYLKHHTLDLKPTTSLSPDSKSKNHNHLHSLGVSGDKKRKLISVIEDVDEQNTCLPRKQKRV